MHLAALFLLFIGVQRSDTRRKPKSETERGKKVISDRENVVFLEMTCIQSLFFSSFQDFYDPRTKKTRNRIKRISSIQTNIFFSQNPLNDMHSFALFLPFSGSQRSVTKQNQVRNPKRKRNYLIEANPIPPIENTRNCNDQWLAFAEIADSNHYHEIETVD